MTKAFLATAFCFLLGCAAWAQADAPVSPSTPATIERLRAAAQSDTWLSNYLRRLEQRIHRGDFNRALAETLRDLHRVAPDGTYSAAAQDLYESRQQALARGRAIGRHLVLDLDANQEISAQERDLASKDDITTAELLFATGDTDGDDKITFSELLAYVEKTFPKQMHRHAHVPFDLFDYDGDGRVARQDIVQTMLAIQQSDTRVIPTQQPTLMARQIQPKPPTFEPDRCEAPPLPDDADLVVFSAQSGNALSTIAIAGTDTTTTLGRLIIEPGDTQIYLFLSSFTPMIWDITGATDRLHHVVIQDGTQNRQSGAGVIGLPEQKVSFVDWFTCIQPFTRVDGKNDAHAYPQVRSSFGRLPDAVFAQQRLGILALPSGAYSAHLDRFPRSVEAAIEGLHLRDLPPDALAPLKEQARQDSPIGMQAAFRAANSTYPGRLRAVQPEQLLAHGAAEAYPLYPGLAGLAQLIAQGALVQRADKSFLIAQPFNAFPLQSLRAHRSDRFFLPETIALPKGVWARASVFSAETGACLAGLCKK